MLARATNIILISKVFLPRCLHRCDIIPITTSQASSL